MTINVKISKQSFRFSQV